MSTTLESPADTRWDESLNSFICTRCKVPTRIRHQDAEECLGALGGVVHALRQIVVKLQEKR